MNTRTGLRSLSVVLLVAVVLFGVNHRAQSQAAAVDQDVLMRSIGALSASFLYQTNLIVGLIADSKANGIYDEETANKVLSDAINMCTAVDKQWEAVHGSGISEAEQKFLGSMGAAGDSIRKQAEELKAFWETGDEAHGKAYEESRAKSSAMIAELLGLK